MSCINTVVTSKEAILKNCRAIVSQKGLPSLNMRTVAEACHVALGSLYNYFPSKDDLVTAVIESVWQDIFDMEHCAGANLSFSEYVRWIFESVRQSAKGYPNFFTAHSIGFASSAKNKARGTMERYFAHMEAGMSAALRNDNAVAQNAFDGGLTESDFIRFVLTNILTLLVEQRQDCEVLLEIVRRTVYPR